MSSFSETSRARYSMGGYPAYDPQGKTAQGVNSTRDAIGGYKAFTYDDYDNQYSSRQNEMLDNILNRPDFSWSKDEDPMWGTYKKSYLREGDRAQSNAMARAAAMSGGRPSSFAVTAASQAGDYYASRLNEIIPQLYQQAYNKYLNDLQMQHQKLGLINEQEQIDYRRFLDDRNFAFDSHNNSFNQLLQQHGMYRGLDDSDWSRAQQSRQEDLQRAYNIFLATGEITTQELADVLGLPVGTLTWDRNFGQQQLAQAAAAAAASRGGGSSRSRSSGGGGSSLPDIPLPAPTRALGDANFWGAGNWGNEYAAPATGGMTR